MASHQHDQSGTPQGQPQPFSGPNSFVSTATQDLQFHMVGRPAAPSPIQTSPPGVSGGTNPFMASTPSSQTPIRSETPVSPALASSNPFLGPATPTAAPSGSNNPFLSPPRGVQATAATGGPAESSEAPPSLAHSRTPPRSPALAPGEGEWKLKEITWPDPRVGGMRRRVRILMQNVNGPCSLLALANVLILRGSIHLPAKLTARISYSELSQLLADFFVSRPPAVNPTREPLSLSAALNILPTTVQGLTINVGFESISSFEATPAHGPTAQDGAPRSEQAVKADLAGGELALFEHAGVDLVHGWLADETDPALWGPLQRAVQQGGDVPASGATRGKMTYDRVQEAIVRGLEVEMRSSASLSAGGKGKQLSAEEQQMLDDSRTLQRFLQETASQLTYPGLFALLELPPGSVVAFFRNSHLGVLYRRPPASAEEAEQAGQTPEPLLFQLITDASFLRDPQYCWEALSDVDGSAARFYDDSFAPAAAGAGGDWSGVSAERVVAEQERQERELQQLERARNMAGGANLADYLDEEDRDLQLARALQEEQDRELAAQHQAAEDRHSRRNNTRLPSGVAARASTQGAEQAASGSRRKGKFGSGSGGEGSGGKDKKCVIM